MSRIAASTTIRRPVQEVFAVVAEPTNMPKWNSAVQSVDKTSDGPTRVGTTFHSTRKVLGREVVMDYQVTEFEVNRRIAQLTTRPFPLTLTLAMEPTTEGTRLDMIADGKPSGLFKLADPIGRRMGNRHHRHALATLRALLEARAL